MTEIKVDVGQNKSKIYSVRQAQELQNEIKALRDITETSKNGVRTHKCKYYGNQRYIGNKKISLKALDAEMNDVF